MKDQERSWKAQKENSRAIVICWRPCPVQGVSYLVEKGMLVYEPRAVATFLLENCDKLDKTQIGEYLGKEIHYKDGFCVQVRICPVLPKTRNM